MTSFAFLGGSTRFIVGPASDIEAFFRCVDRYVARRFPDTDFSLLTERFYRHYLRLEELTPAKALMDRIHATFASVSTASVDWNAMGSLAPETRLVLGGVTLADVFTRLFRGFGRVVEQAEYDFVSYVGDGPEVDAEIARFRRTGAGRHIDRDVYNPVFIGRGDSLGAAMKADLSPMELDATSGVPRWLSPPVDAAARGFVELMVQRHEMGTTTHIARYPSKSGKET